MRIKIKEFQGILIFAMIITSGCSNDDSYTLEPDINIPVAFNTYVEGGNNVSSISTRTGEVAPVGAIQNVDRLRQYGFGVFSYYTEGNNYAGNTRANFMWDQKIEYSSGWTYSPLRYWPTESTRNSVVVQNLLSFFSYAPFYEALGGTACDVTGNINAVSAQNFMAKTGANNGIVAISNNNYVGDPLVLYKVGQNPSEHVDLLWGVVPSGTTSYQDASGNTVALTPGRPYANMSQQSRNSNVNFHFKHALMRIGLNVQCDYSGTGDDAENGIQTLFLFKDASIRINTPNSATLNLNNTVANTPLWQNIGYQTVVSEDDETAVFGRGKTTLQIDSSFISPSLRDFDYGSNSLTTEEKNSKWSFAYTNKENTRNLLKDVAVGNSSVPAYYMIIPDTCTHSPRTVLEISATYSIQIRDPRLVLTNGFTRQLITRNSTLVLEKFQAGKAYTINIILSRNKMEFKVSCDDWQEPISYNPDVDLWAETTPDYIDLHPNIGYLPYVTPWDNEASNRSLDLHPPVGYSNSVEPWENDPIRTIDFK